MGHDMGNGEGGTLVETGGGTESRYGTLDLGIVEDDGMGLVAEKVALKVIVLAYGSKERRRHMVGLEGDAEVGGDDLMNLVPCEVFVARDMERIADGMLVAHQSDECLGKICVVGNSP